MPFKNIGTNLSINACGSRCIAVAAHQSGHLQVRRKQSLRQALRYWDVAKSALYLPLPAGSQPGAIQLRVMSSPASNAACSIAAYFRFACSTVGVLGFWASSASKRVPQRTLPLAKSVQSFHGF